MNQLRGTGILHKGFTVHNDCYQIILPKGIKVVYDEQPGPQFGKAPHITYIGTGLEVIKIGDKWYALFHGQVMLMNFPGRADRKPYPLSLFEAA